MSEGDGATIGDLTRLEQHLREVIAAHDRLDEQRFKDAEKAVQAALAAAKEAVHKAEAASDKRFEGVNEFRQTLADQQGTFIPRKEAEQRIESNAIKIADVERRLNDMQAVARGGRELWVLIAGVITFLLGVGAFVLKALPSTRTP